MHDVVVVGAGMAGLTASAYLARQGYSVLICEKNHTSGGLVQSFERDGFVYDAGIRAIEDSGIVDPMLRDLGISLEFTASPVSVGLGEDILRVHDAKSIEAYHSFLVRHFPDRSEDIRAIIDVVRLIMRHMDVLYGIENPALIDLKKDPAYLFRTLLPWLFKFPLTIRKINRLNTPVDEYIDRFTTDRSLKDHIIQHFFRKIPAFFALSYFRLYLDYRYPRGGTGSLSAALHEYVTRHGVEIRYGARIAHIDPVAKSLVDTEGTTYEYRKCLWAADQKRFYDNIDTKSIRPGRVRRRIERFREEIRTYRGGDSVLTVYAGSDLEPGYFAERATGHLFYTPVPDGVSGIDTSELERILANPAQSDDRDHAISALRDWIHQYLSLTTYEISIPALRDPAMAPEGQTGLIISTLIDYSIVALTAEIGWYSEFKELCERLMISTLSRTLYPKLEGSIIHRFSSTPKSIREEAGTTDGAITGWAFTNPTMPSENRFLRITNSVRTPVPDIVQAGQWTFSPSGLPIAILTGKLAADRIMKSIRPHPSVARFRRR